MLVIPVQDLAGRDTCLAGTDAKVRIGENVRAVISGPEGVRRIVLGKNIITNAGDLYYAQKGAGESPTVDFPAGGIRLGTGSTAPTKGSTDVTTFATGSGKADKATYPKTNDSDGNNSGAGTDIITWAYEWTPGDFTASGINEGAIVDNTTTPTAALCHFLFSASFNITATEALTVFVNHTVNGV